MLGVIIPYHMGLACGQSRNASRQRLYPYSCSPTRKLDSDWWTMWGQLYMKWTWPLCHDLSPGSSRCLSHSYGFYNFVRIFQRIFRFLKVRNENTAPSFDHAQLELGYQAVSIPCGIIDMRICPGHRLFWGFESRYCTGSGPTVLSGRSMPSPIFAPLMKYILIQTTSFEKGVC